MLARISATRWALLCALTCVPLSGCSLISLKSPERPLPPQQLNARILVRELSTQFIEAVGRSSQSIAATEDDQQLLDNTLRWEIAAVAQSRRAATQLAPLLSLLDTWALAEQLQAFVAAGGAGGTLFGSHQGAIREICDDYAADAQNLAHSVLTAEEYTQYQQFIAGYVRQYPLRDLSLQRTSVIELWGRQHGQAKLVDTLGTIPEALADAAQRLQIYGETVPPQVMRQTELALRESGYSRAALQGSLKELDERMERLTRVAESAPELVRGAESEVRQSLREVLDRLNASSAAATQAMHTERIALFADLQAQREALMAEVDLQRKALAVNADQLIQTSGQQVRALLRDVAVLGILLLLVLFGLPFVAGYHLGKARGRRGLHPD
jgi:hypothetical protein